MGVIGPQQAKVFCDRLGARQDWQAFYENSAIDNVLDLLSETDIRVLLDEARCVLRPAGPLCLVGLTQGKGLLSTVIMSLWQTLHAWRPTLLGGCRPLDLRTYLGGTNWTLTHHAVVRRFGITSEVVVAARHD